MYLQQNQPVVQTSSLLGILFRRIHTLLRQPFDQDYIVVAKYEVLTNTV